MSRRKNDQDLSLEQLQLKKAKAKKTRAILLAIFMPLVAVFVVNMVILPFTGGLHRLVKNPDTNGNQFIKEGTSLAAHRLGGDVYPEESMMAFKGAWLSGKVDVLEFDLHMTKDGYIVLNHDHTLDRTTDSLLKFHDEDIEISDLTLAELKTLNMGYHFKDANGNYPYRYASESNVPDDLRFATLDEVLQYLYSVDTTKRLEYIIEVKDDGDEGKLIMDGLYDAMVRYDILDRTIVGTFHADISKYIDEKYLAMGVTRSASVLEVLNFYYAFMWGVPINVKYDVLQIPMGLTGVYFSFSTQAFVDYAHSYGIAVQYWTINDADDAAHLVSIGADAVMTDDYHMCYDAMNR